MGQLHHVLTPAELGKLNKEQKKELQKKLTQEIENDPMLKEIVKRHGVVRKHLRQKLKI
jgi:protein required for attachment to host cells